MRNVFSYVAHHGMVFIPLGYGKAFADITNLQEVHGGTPYGASTFAGANGSRKPSELELRIAKTQGETFASSAAKIVAASKSSSTDTSGPASTEKEASASKEKEAVESEESSEAPKTEKKTPQRVQESSKPAAKEDSGCGVKCVIV